MLNGKKQALKIERKKEYINVITLEIRKDNDLTAKGYRQLILKLPNLRNINIWNITLPKNAFKHLGALQSLISISLKIQKTDVKISYGRNFELEFKAEVEVDLK